VYASLSLARDLAPEAADASFVRALEEAKFDAESEAAEAEEDGGENDDEGDAEGDAGDPTGDGREALAAGRKGETSASAPGDDEGPRAPALDPAVAGRIGATEPDRAVEDRGGSRDRDDDEYEDNPYVMRIAGATSPRPPSAARTASEITVAGAAAPAVRLALDLSGGVMADDAADRGWAIARAVARAGAKLAITRAIEHEAGEKNEAVGRILGAVANAGAVLLERADTRSWALVPDRIEVLRLDLPPGEHALAVRDGRGDVRDLGVVRVVGGETRIVFASAATTDEIANARRQSAGIFPALR
jgi:hypothetical protein